MYSQNNEEQIITDFFQDTVGRFLDIGAYTGKELSNTCRLAELGWSGVLVEPSPLVMPALLQLHGGNNRMHIVNAAVCPDAVYEQCDGLSVFFDSGGDAVSTTSIAHKQKWEQGANSTFRQFFINPLPLSRLLHQFGTNFDFISIDVESTNWSLFCAMPWAELRTTRMVCVEHDGRHVEMQRMLEPFGFRERAFNGENLILVR